MDLKIAFLHKIIEANLHACVVKADKVGDEVEVSGDENHEEENLGFPRDSRAAPGFPYLAIKRNIS